MDGGQPLGFDPIMGRPGRVLAGPGISWGREPATPPAGAAARPTARCFPGPKDAVRRSSSMPSPNTTSWSEPTLTRSVSPVCSTPSVREDPVMREGQASRTNQARPGIGRFRQRPSAAFEGMDAQQPVAPCRGNAQPRGRLALLLASRRCELVPGGPRVPFRRAAIRRERRPGGKPEPRCGCHGGFGRPACCGPGVWRKNSVWPRVACRSKRNQNPNTPLWGRHFAVMSSSSTGTPDFLEDPGRMTTGDAAGPPHFPGGPPPARLPVA
jgi:hypothetical protein